MGYYTHYELKAKNPKPNIISDEELIAHLRLTCEDARFALTEAGETQDTCKWYEHEGQMAEFSKRYPEVVFELSGEGEEGQDIWKKYFKNGKVQRCPAKIAYELFDETRMEEVS